MRTILVIMSDLLILVVALLAVTEYHALKRYASFTVPFTDRLIACGALPEGERARVLRQDRNAHIVGIALCLIVWLMLTVIFAGISGAITFPVATAALLLVLRPGLEDSPENREQYLRAHRKDIDMEKNQALNFKL